MKLTYEDGFKAGYQKGYLAGRKEGLQPESPETTFVVTAEHQTKYPDFDLPLGKKIELIKDLGGNIIGYQPLNG